MTNNKSLFTILFTIFIDMLGYGILIPVIPVLFAAPQSPYYLLAPGTDPKQAFLLLGFLLAAFPIAQFFAAPILGQMSDVWGRKRVLIISLLGTALSYLLFAYGIITRNLPLLFAARILDGFTGGNIAVAQATIADITAPENRAKTFGLIGAAFGLGFIIGPYLGGKLSDPAVVSWFNAATPFWFAALLSLLNITSVFFFLKETLKNAKPQASIKLNRALHNIYHAFTIRGMRSIFSTGFLFQAGFAFFTSFFAVFLLKRFGFTQGNTGDYFAYIGIWIVLTQGFITRIVTKYFSEQKILRFSILGTGLMLLSYFLPTHSWQLFLIAPVFAICNGLSQANLTSLVSRNAPPDVQGEVLGLNTSVNALAQSIPPIVSGYLAGVLTPETPLMLSGTVIIFGAFIFWTTFKPSSFVNKK